MPTISPLAVSARFLSVSIPCSRSHAHRVMRQHGVLVAGVWRLPVSKLREVVGEEMSKLLVERLTTATNL
jgi:hypothetical protein